MERLAGRGASELLDAAMASILERVPAYRDADPALLADVRGHIAVQFDLFCDGAAPAGAPWSRARWSSSPATPPCAPAAASR